MASPYKAFNHQLKTFFRECDKTFPELVCFKIMLGAYKLLKSMNKKLPQKYWQNLVMLKHGDSIRSRSDASFFDPNFAPPAIYSSMVDSMKNTWILLDAQTKNTIFDHMQVLVAINDKCIEYRISKNKPPIETLEDDAIVDDQDD